MRVGFVIFLFFYGALPLRIQDITDKFQQSDYKVAFEWGEVLRYTKPYVRYFHGVVFKYNRTCTAGNLTYEYNIDVGNDLELITQAYKFASNEYRLFPLRIQLNFCRAVNKNLIGSQGAFKCGNFTGCPILKGKRDHVCNFAPDDSQFPPFIPTGKYMLEVQGVHKGNEMFVLRVYGSVLRPVMN